MNSIIYRHDEALLEVVLGYFNASLLEKTSKDKVEELYWISEEFAFDGLPGVRKYLLDNTDLLDNIKHYNIGGRSFLKITQKDIVRFIHSIPKEVIRIYLMDDAVIFYDADVAVNKNRDHSYQILISRSQLGYPSRKENYLKLLNAVYKAFLENRSGNFQSFYSRYLQNVETVLERNEFMRIFAERVFNSIKLVFNKTVKKNKLVFIDTGYGGTFVLFCCALLDLKGYSKKIQKNIYLYSVWPWFRDIYREKYYSLDFWKVRSIEGFDHE